MYCLMFKLTPKDKTLLWIDSWNVIPMKIDDIETARIEKANFIKYLKASSQWNEYNYKVEIANWCNV